MKELCTREAPVSVEWSYEGPVAPDDEVRELVGFARKVSRVREQKYPTDVGSLAHAKAILNLCRSLKIK